MNPEPTAPPMARSRLAAGALFVDDRDRVMLVRPTYKKSWDIPGGYVEPGESPRDACIREVREELAIEPPIGRLLVIDWAPNDTEGDKILFVFDGGTLGHSDASRLQVDNDELSAYRYVDLAGFPELMTDRLTLRIGAAWHARCSAHPVYLEHGRPVMDPASSRPEQAATHEAR